MVHHMAWNNFNYSLKRRFYQDKQHAMMHNNDHNGVALHIYTILFIKSTLQYQSSNTSDKNMYIYSLCSKYINSHPMSKYMQIVFRIHVCAKPAYFMWHSPIFHRVDIHIGSHISIILGFFTISVVQITKRQCIEFTNLNQNVGLGMECSNILILNTWCHMTYHLSCVQELNYIEFVLYTKKFY